MYGETGGCVGDEVSEVQVPDLTWILVFYTGMDMLQCSVINGSKCLHAHGDISLPR